MAMNFVLDWLSRVLRLPSIGGLINAIFLCRALHMRLTTYTDYSLRVLMYVAVRPDPLPTISQITESYGISKNHVMKVVSGLSQLGYLRTIQGKGGGLTLGRPADSIVVGELVRATEPDLALMPCFEPLNEECAIYPSCALKRAVHEARKAFLEVLDRYTLSDLTRNRTALRGLLAASGAVPIQGPKGNREEPRVTSKRSPGRSS